MDVKELMMFKPSQTPKRPNPSDPSKSQEEVEEGEYFTPPRPKRSYARTDSPEHKTPDIDEGEEYEKEEEQEQYEEGAAS